jgi:tetratricopeptide (TPR) repeat protein
MTTRASVDLVLAQTLVDCAVARHSGIVTAVRGKLRRLFCLEEGHLVLALSNVIEEQLSELLVGQELVSVGNLATARQACDGKGQKLSRSLVDSGIVEERALRRALEEQLRELLFSTLDWTDGEATFTRGRPDIEGQVLVTLPCVALLVEYARCRPESLHEVRARVGSTAVRLEAREQRADLLAEVDLGPISLHLLARCDGGTPIADLLGDCPGSEEEAWRALYALRLIDVAGPSTEGRAADEVTRNREETEAEIQRVRNISHYDVLDVPPHASADVIREAYYVLARRYHPDRFRAGPLQDLLRKVETYFAIVTEAYNTLYNPRLRAGYDEQRLSALREGPEQSTAYLARENLRRAKELVAKGRFTDAVKSLENAIKLESRNAVYRLELGQLLARNPRLRAQAEEHLIEVNRLDPAQVEGYLALGDLYLKTNRAGEAIRLFREVLRWEPGHSAATERLRELGAA